MKTCGRILSVLLMVVLFLFFLSGIACNEAKKRARYPDSLSDSTKGAAFNVASYNIRYHAKADDSSGNGWDTRKFPLAQLIKDHHFDIIGTQEGDSGQMHDLMELLPGFAFVGYPYGGASGTIHTASIVYRESAFSVLDQGEFWYSETPDEKSIGWDATDLRICTWARMKDKASGLEFYFFTSHFYWRYKTARRHSGKVLVTQIKSIVKDDLPVISTGDLNSVPSTPQIADISAYLRDAYKVSTIAPVGPEATAYHGGVFQGSPNNRIDYIFVSKKVEVLSYAALNDTYGQDRHPSDHLPITAEIHLEE